MLLQKKLKKSLKLPTKHSDYGKKKVRFNAIEHQEIIDGISLPKNNLKNTPRHIKKIISIQGCPVKNKKGTLNGKLNICKKNTLTTELLRTLEVDSITKEKGLKPFWTNSSRVISEQLWLPQKTDLLGLDSNSLNIYSKSSGPTSSQLIPNKLSLLEKNFPKILSQLLRSSHPDTTVDENITYTRKIRIYPSNKQLDLFNKCFGATRFFYNKTSDFVNKKYTEKHKELKKLSHNGCVKLNKDKVQCCKDIDENSKYFCKKHIKSKIKYDYKLTLSALRKEILTSNKDLTDDIKWQKDIPYDTRQLSIKEFIGSYKSALSNKKNGNIDKFKMGYKYKHSLKQSFHIDHRAINPDALIFKRTLKKHARLRFRKKMNNWWKRNIKEIVHDCKIIKETKSKYYLCITLERKKKSIKPRYNIVSLDPGIRTFQTYYNPDGTCGKLGNNIINDLVKKAKRIDLFRSLIDKEILKKRRYNMRKRYLKLITKIKNIVK